MARQQVLAVLTLGLLQLSTVAAGVAVVNLTSEPHPAVRAPAVAFRQPIDGATPVPTAGLSAPVPDGAALTERLTDLADGISAAVIDADTGKVLFDHDGDQSKTPASTTKLVTSVGALAALGPTYRITTKVVQGDKGGVVLVGGGDPTLTARNPEYGAYPRYASLNDLARQTAAALTKAGIKEVRVDYDTKLYEGGPTANGWKDNYLPDGEVAPMSALTVDEGRVKVGEQDRVDDPAKEAAETFVKMLDRNGVDAETGKSAEAASNAQTLGAVQSPPLSAMVERLMTVSDNDLAEALLRQVAIKHGKPASFEGGVQAVTEELTRLGVQDGVQVNDGSGLSTKNRITPLALARIAALAASNDRPELRAAITGMPVAGFTGTLAAPRYTGSRTASGAGVVRAKTGTLSGVSTLAGLAYDADGRVLAFAFMLGDGKGPVDPGRLDVLAATVAACCAARGS